MLKQKIMIKNPTGLHVRPAGIFCKAAVQFECGITLTSRHSNANGKSFLSVLGACIKRGDEIELACDGVDEEQAMECLIGLIEDGLGE